MSDITLERVLEMMNFFRSGGRMPYIYVITTIQRIINILQAIPNVQPSKIPENGRLTVVGDMHGQIEDLFYIFKMNGIPSETK
jgi:hypothetical protein